MGGGLAYDPADDTLWMFNWRANRLEQYSKTGSLLSTITGPGIYRVYGLEFAISPDLTPPAISLKASPTILWPPTGAMVPVTVTGRISDDEYYASGLNTSTAAYTVTDDYGKVEPAGSIQLQPDGTYSFVILLQASRSGTDPEGRDYIITVTAQDQAGNTGTAATSVTVPHDRGNGSRRPYVY